MNVSLPPPETIHVHFPHFLLSAFRCMEGCCLRLQERCFSPARPQLFARKTIAFRPQDLWFWSPRAPSERAKTYGLGGQKHLPTEARAGGRRPALWPALTRINL